MSDMIYVVCVIYVIYIRYIAYSSVGLRVVPNADQYTFSRYNDGFTDELPTKMQFIAGQVSNADQSVQSYPISAVETIFLLGILFTLKSEDSSRWGSYPGMFTEATFGFVWFSLGKRVRGNADHRWSFYLTNLVFVRTPVIGALKST